MAFRVEKLTPKSEGILRALASVRIGSALVHDFRVVQQVGQKAFVQAPLRVWVANGKTCYGGPLVEFPANVLAALEDEVLKAFEAGAFSSSEPMQTADTKGVYTTSGIRNYRAPVEADTLTTGEGPSEKQRNYLRVLGHRGAEPTTKAEASALIEEYKKNRELGF